MTNFFETLAAVILRIRRIVSVGLFNLLVWFLLGLYLLPVLFMAVTAFKSTDQLSDVRAPWYPSRRVTYEYQGASLSMYRVPVEGAVCDLALLTPGTTRSIFIDPANPEAGPITWLGDRNTLAPVYEPYLALSNFTSLWNSVSFPQMMGNTLILVLIGEVGVLVSSILVAYGFSRFPIPGGDLLFYVLIATILVPEKVTFIPVFFFYVKVVHWQGTILPLVVNLFFGNAVFIFLLRQNFKGIPASQEESAMLDGAGPLRRLWSIHLPQSWPVLVTVALLQFFYTWNEIKLASLYLGSNTNFRTVATAVQNYQSFTPIQNMIEASNLFVMIVPVIVLIFSQRFFMRSMIITGMEKK